MPAKGEVMGVDSALTLSGVESWWKMRSTQLSRIAV